MHIAEKILWDVPPRKRDELAGALQEDPAGVLEENEALFVKALNSLTWYELISLFGPEKLEKLLTDDVIIKVFPAKRREYYKNARRLLSEYALSSSG